MLQIRRHLLVLLFGAVALGILLSLGTWQVQRLAWKEQLIANVETRRTQAAIAAPSPDGWDGLSVAELEYQNATLTGRFDHSNERHLFFPLSNPQGPLGGAGVMVFTPFQTQEGWWILINRGFVPIDWRDPSKRSDGQTSGEISLSGLIRGYENRSWLNPEPSQSDGLYYIRDRKDFLAGLEAPDRSFAPYYLDAVAASTPKGGVPQAGETRISFTNNHLQYAATWYGLAAALAAVVIAFLWGQRAKSSLAPDENVDSQPPSPS